MIGALAVDVDVEDSHETYQERRLGLNESSVFETEGIRAVFSSPGPEPVQVTFESLDTSRIAVFGKAGMERATFTNNGPKRIDTVAGCERHFLHLLVVPAVQAPGAFPANIGTFGGNIILF